MSLSPTCSASTLVRFPDPRADGSGNLTTSTLALQKSCTVTKKWERHGRAIWRGMLHGKIHMWEAWGWRKCLATTHLLPATTTCHKRQCCSPCNMHPHPALSVERFFSPHLSHLRPTSFKTCHNHLPKEAVLIPPAIGIQPSEWKGFLVHTQEGKDISHLTLSC